MQPKLIVLADSSGSLISAYIRGEQKLGAPTQIAFSASANQITREVEIPEELRKVELSGEILQNYRLHVHQGGCSLVPVRPAELS